MIEVKYPYKSLRWAFMRWADIPDARDENRVYLRRLRILQTPLFAIYLHFIYLTDEDLDPHDHPANFWSFILRGGYTEVLYRDLDDPHGVEVKTHRRLSLHRMPVTWAHRIIRIRGPLVTLCLFGRRQRDWGFWVDRVIVDWREYNRTRYGVNPQDMMDEFA